VEKLYFYGVPGKVGGAATKIRDLVRMLRHDFAITMVFGNISFTKDRDITNFLAELNVPYCLRKDVPPKAEGIALAMCELDFFTSGTAASIKEKGLRLVWSNEMVWEFNGEASAVQQGLVDRVLFVSHIQQEAFKELYRRVPQEITGNYISPDDFPYTERKNEVFTIGRLSRPDPVKYPVDFPVFYEELELDDVRYRVQAWSDELRKIYKWHKFGPEWELLPEKKIPTAKFLSGLDLFVYPLGHRFVESWGRSVVEAMLTGAVPLVPAGHNFSHLIVHGESGFLCESFCDFREWARTLYKDHRLLRNVSEKAANHAREVLCNFEEHRRAWVNALSFN